MMRNPKDLVIVFTVVALIAIALMAGGCASNTLSQEELDTRQYNRQIDLENWAVCAAIYEANGQPTWHKGHTHSNKGRANRSAKDDLMHNNCRQIMRGLWADHI